MEKKNNNKLNLMKVASIAMILVVMAMSLCSWVSLGADPYGGYIIKDTLESVWDEVYNEEDLDMAQDMLDEADIDLQVDDLVADMDAMINPLLDLGISPIDLIRVTNGFNGLVEFMTSPELEDLGYSIAEDSDDLLAMNVIRTILTVGVALLIINMVVCVLHIIFHIANRRGLGISIVVFTILNILYMGLVWLVAMAAVSEMGSVAMPTAAPFVAFICAILSCVFWGSARKHTNVQVQQVFVPVPQVGGQPVATPPQVDVQPVVTEPQKQPKMKFCTKCGAQLIEEARFCTKCGSEL